jgi:phage terminase large subunit
MLNIEVIEKIVPIYQPMRYKCLYGGRASGKSLGVADFLIIQTAFNRKRVLCCREFQSSIKDSVHRVLSDRINELGLSDKFTITRDEIRSVAGSVFIFKGLAHNYTEIKSTQGIDYCWVEEAERLSAESWEVLIPTIREENSEIIITFNPADEKNPTYQRFVINPPENSIIIKINYYDNPFLPNVLLQEIEHDQQYNPDRFKHIWEGECAKMSNAVVFKDKFVIKPVQLDIQNNASVWFNGKRVIFKYGLDFGFSVDPTAAIEAFIHDGNLYITSEMYRYHLENDDIIPAINESINRGMSAKWYADSARPETISQLSKVRTHRDGYLLKAISVEPAIKGKGSVEDGISYLKNFKSIIIDPKCKNTIFEFENYKYKQDKQTGDIFTDLEDKNNHAIDALRYAFNEEIQALKRRPMSVNPALSQRIRRLK